MSNFIQTPALVQTPTGPTQQPQQFTHLPISGQSYPSRASGVPPQSQHVIMSPQPQYGWQHQITPQGPSMASHPVVQQQFHGQAAPSTVVGFGMNPGPMAPITPMQTASSTGNLGMGMGMPLGMAYIPPQTPLVMTPMSTGPGPGPGPGPTMPQLLVPSQYQPRIIVGIDFGTTYSGIAYAYTLPPGSPQQPEINIIQGWPNCGNRAYSQAPTEIAYEEQNPAEFRWGFDIRPTQTRLKWFKLALESEDEHVHEQYSLPPGKQIFDVVADFFTALYQHAMSQLYIAMGEVVRMTPVDFVVTVPAVWSELAIQRTQQAAERAGMKNGHELSLLTEPEAAALYTLKCQEQGRGILVGDKFVVCDAGGGTVDLISYAVRQATPSLQVEEIAVGTGDLCGSSFIDRAFETLFKTKMGPHYDTMRIAQRQMVVKNFENVKCAFRDRPDQQYYHVDVPGKDDIPEAGVVDGQFQITREEMRSLFDPVVNEITKLIDGQVQAAHASAGAPGGDGIRVQYVLLVGGFGESQYLYKKVSEWALPYQIIVLQPSNGSSAVVKGAVIRGLEKASLLNQHPNTMALTNSTVIRKSRKHYGSLNAVKFIPGVHLEQDAFIHPKSREKMARDQIIWFINKGQPISEHIKLSQFYHRHFRKVEQWVDTLVVCEDDIPPTRLGPNVRVLCYLHADLTKVPKTRFDKKYRIFRKYYTCNYQVDMVIESATLRFEMWYKGINYGAVRADFDT